MSPRTTRTVSPTRTVVEQVRKTLVWVRQHEAGRNVASLMCCGALAWALRCLPGLLLFHGLTSRLLRRRGDPGPALCGFASDGLDVRTLDVPRSLTMTRALSSNYPAAVSTTEGAALPHDHGVEHLAAVRGSFFTETFAIWPTPAEG